MDKKNPKILIVGPDRTLQREVESALAAIEDINPVTIYAPDFRQGIESARNRRPEMALVEMGRDNRYLRMFVEEVGAASPETAIAAVFHPSTFSEHASESEVVIEALRLGVQDFLRRPISSKDLEQFLQRTFKYGVGRQNQQGIIATFFSNKGGVGKSTLAVNVACALGKTAPGRVLLVDGSLQMGVCANLLDMTPRTSIMDAVRERDRLDETLVRELSVLHEPSGVHLLAAPADAVEASKVDDELMSRVLTLARRAFDYVVVDTFPMLDSVMMAVLDLADRRFLVTESVVPTLRGALRLLKTLDDVRIPSEGRRIVLNRYSTFDGNLRPDDVAKRIGSAVEHVVPYQKKLLVAANLGTPYIFSAGVASDFRRAIGKIVEDIQGARSGSRSSGPRSANEVNA